MNAVIYNAHSDAKNLPVCNIQP